MTFRLVAAALVLACAVVASLAVARTKKPGSDAVIACICPQKTPDWLCRVLCL